MTGDKVKQAVDEMRSVAVEKHGYNPPFPARFERDTWPTAVDAMRHVLWMCDQVDGFVDAGRIWKAMRWLGFMQGVVWAHGTPLERLKKMNMPTAEEEDPT